MLYVLQSIKYIPRTWLNIFQDILVSTPCALYFCLTLWGITDNGSCPTIEKTASKNTIKFPEFFLDSFMYRTHFRSFFSSPRECNIHPITVKMQASKLRGFVSTEKTFNCQRKFSFFSSKGNYCRIKKSGQEFFKQSGNSLKRSFSRGDV